MRRAFLSDSHSNIFALDAVFADIDTQNIDEIIFLGDAVGYGSRPVECLARLRARCKLMLRGNHDFAVLNPEYAAKSKNDTAIRAWDWTRKQLATDAAAGHLDFLATLTSRAQVDHLVLCHGTPAKPLDEYFNPTDLHDDAKMCRVFDHLPVGGGGFGGHTHYPGVFVNQRGTRWYSSQQEIESTYRIPEGMKFFVNVGSVGQPRDGDPNACYVIFDGAAVEFRRVAYDIESAVADILAIPELDEHSANRLRTGV